MLYRIKKYKDFIAAVEKLNTNVKKWKLLGEGGYGRAYDMGDGRVCKITTNERETKAALKIKKSKKKYSYLYKVLDVFVIKGRKNFKYGIIITPKYKKLTDHQKTELYELFCFLDFSPRFRLRSFSQVKNKIARAARHYYKPVASYAGFNSIVDTIIEKRIKILKKFNILNMLRNLKAVKLGPEDMHYDNILRDGDHFIFIDIAC